MEKSAPLLIVVQGAPASGKSSLARRIEADLRLPLISKDDIKEFLFDRIPQSDRNFSTVQGKAAIAMMYAGAEVFLNSHKDIIIESAFYTEFARGDIEKITGPTNARVFEIFVHCDETVRRERFVTRAHDGTRHPGHQDHFVAAPGEVDNANLDVGDKYSRMNIGESIEVDTTRGITDKEYDAILSKIKERL